MKKLFFLAATLCGAMAINAASFTGFDARTTNLGTQIHDNNLIQNQVNVTLDETDKDAHKYSILLTEGGIEGSFTMGGVKFKYTNSTAGTTAYKTYGTYIQPNGKDRIIEIPTTSGEKVDIYLTEKCDGVTLSGAGAATSIDFVAGVNTLTATGNMITLTVVSNKPKFQAIIPNTGTGLMETAAPAEVKKVIIDGKLFILNTKGELVSVLGF